MERDLTQQDLWGNYAKLQHSCPKPDGEAKVYFYYNNSEFIIRDSNNSDPEIAIVIPAFNEEKYLPRTLAAINQVLRDEKNSTSVVVVNNASTDATSDIAKTFGAIVVDEPKKGIGQARQTGLESLPTSVKYVLTTDADTVIPLDWIKLHYQSLQQQNVSCTYGGAKFLTESDIKLTDQIMYFIYEEAIKIARSIQHKPNPENIGGCNTGLVKNIALEIGGYNRELTCGEDLDILERMSNLGESVKIDSIVSTSARRIFGKGITQKFNFAVKYALNLCIGRKISKDKPFLNEYIDYR